MKTKAELSLPTKTNKVDVWASKQEDINFPLMGTSYSLPTTTKPTTLHRIVFFQSDSLKS